MKIGKLSTEQLNDLVLSRLPAVGENVVCGPGIGLDCAALSFQDGLVVLSSDPITGAAEDIGRIAVHISCNDIAAAGVRPTALMFVLIAPPSATAEEIAKIMDDASTVARSLSVSIVGGHTEISDAVTRFVVITTAIGFSVNNRLIDARSARPGDTLIMTKTAGLEGTTILATDQGERLRPLLNLDEIIQASRLIDQISVVPEGVLCAELDVHAMHDATEGGILGAVYELCDACHCGCQIDIDLIPLHPLTRKIAQVMVIDPYRLLASGSLLIATPEPEAVIAALTRACIPAASIGRLTASPDRLMTSAGQTTKMLPPMPDELYKIF